MNTITDTEPQLRGNEALIAALGVVHAERFVSLILREPFDYTRGDAEAAEKKILCVSASPRLRVSASLREKTGPCT